MPKEAQHSSTLGRIADETRITSGQSCLSVSGQRWRQDQIESRLSARALVRLEYDVLNHATYSVFYILAMSRVRKHRGYTVDELDEICPISPKAPPPDEESVAWKASA